MSSCAARWTLASGAPATASRGKYGTWWLGDWQGIASGADAFHLVWNDTRTGKLDLFAATVRL